MKRRDLLVPLTVIAALLAGGGLQSIDPPPAAAVTSSWLDDRDQRQWAYTGSWTHASGEVWSAGNEGGSESFSRAPGARATVQFEGTGVDIVGPRGSNGGRLRVTLDCGVQRTISSYAAQKQFGQTLASFTGLPRGEHTVVIEVLGSRESASSDTYVMIDGVRTSDAGGGDPTTRWTGTAGNAPASSDAVPLRMPGCGGASSLVEQLKARTVGGWFPVPGAERIWGAVNGHSVTTPQGIAGGPVVSGGMAYEAATIPLSGSGFVTMQLRLPDRPRTAVFTVAADERMAQPVSFAVTGEDGMVLPARIIRGGTSSRTQERASEMFTLQPGELTLVAVDLADRSGVGVNGKISLVASSTSGMPAELDIFEGRVAHLSPARLAAAYGVPATGVPHGAVPFDYFRDGPVVLSRVLADSGAVAWVGDQNSRAGSGGAAVPFLFGDTPTGSRLKVAGVAQPADAIAIRLPESSADTSSVHVRLDTGRQCRALTASVGIDDSTPDRQNATVRVAAYAANEQLPISHNGTWAYAENNSINGEFSSGDTRSPLTESAPRDDVAEGMREAKLAMGADAFHADSSALAAYTALVNRQYEELSATVENPSMSLMTYPIDGALVLGSGTNALLQKSAFHVGEPSLGSQTPPRTLDITPIDPWASYPISIDLAEPHLMRALRLAAQSTSIPLSQVQSPLATEVDLVVSGTPGATVVLAGAALDCVATDVSTRVFPMWSTVGVRPAFLPTPTDRDGDPIAMLVYNPLWWDTVCPAGVSSTSGITFTAQKTRETVWADLADGIEGLDEVKVTQVATSKRAACTLPADQRYADAGEFELAPDSPDAPDDPAYQVIRDDTTDPINSQLLAIDGSVSDRAFDWLKTSYRVTMDHPLEFALWAALAPFDLPASLAMNPFVMNALPGSVGIAAGLAFLPSAAMEGMEASLAAGEGVVSSAQRPLESTNELLLGSADAHAAEVASGKRLTLILPDGELSIPVRTGEGGEAVADIGSHTTSTTVVASDRAIERMPIVSDEAPWVTDEAVESRAVCTRGIEPVCHVSIEPDGVAPDTTNPTWTTAEAPGVEVPPVTHEPSSLWVRAPDLTAGFTFEVRPANGGWQNPNAAAGWQDLHNEAGLQVPAGFANLVMDNLRVSIADVAISTSTEPAYVFSRLDPATVAVQGFESDPDAWEAFVNGNTDPANAWAARSPSTIEDTLFVAATRDPDLLGSGLPLDDMEASWYRYRIERPQGGGIDLFASISNPNAPASVRQLASDPVVAARADLLYFRIDPADIARVDEMQYVNGRFQATASAPMPGSPNIPLTAREMAGRPVPMGQDFPKFDWWVPTELDDDRQIMVTAEHIPVGAGPTDTIVYTKQSGWRTVPQTWNLSDQTLLDSGFIRGHWEATQFEPATPEVWVPKPQMQLFIGGSVTVDLEPGFITTLGGH